MTHSGRRITTSNGERILRITLLGIIAVFLLAPGSCSGHSTAIVAQYQFGPVIFAVDSAGNISVTVGASIATPLGTFTVGASDKLRNSTSELVIFHDNRRPPASANIAYRIRTDKQLVAVVNGRTVLSFSAGQVTIDTSNGTLREVKLQVGGATPVPGNGTIDTVPAIPAATAPGAAASVTLPPPVDTPTTLANSYLADANPVAGGVEFPQTASANGIQYVHPVVISPCASSSTNPTSFAEYDLGRHTRTLGGVVAFRDDSPSSSVGIATIYVDGSIVFQVNLKFGETFPFMISTTGRLRLRLEVSSSSTNHCEYDNWIVFGDPVLAS